LELGVIEKMGFSSYFLIVSDLIAASRRLGYSVGPGRGSAAGSIVAYLTGITRIDPLRYRLLFERFLNPERLSMPDIDIDFTPVGKQKVLDYTVEKYGAESVAKVIAIGTLGAKAAIRDAARVLDVPLTVADQLAKLVPQRPGITLETALSDVRELKEMAESCPQNRELMTYATALEGRARNVQFMLALWSLPAARWRSRFLSMFPTGLRLRQGYLWMMQLMRSPAGRPRKMPILRAGNR